MVVREIKLGGQERVRRRVRENSGVLEEVVRANFTWDIVECSLSDCSGKCLYCRNVASCPEHILLGFTMAIYILQYF